MDNGLGRLTLWQRISAPSQNIIIPMLIKGPDVSFYQDDNNTARKIDFVKMKAAGARFVVCRAGQNLWPDEDFQDYWLAAKLAGLPRSTYFLMDSRKTPVEQADLYYEIIRYDLPEGDVVVDYEETYGGPYGGWKNLKAFIERLIERGIPASKIVIYTGYYYWKDHCPSLTTDLNWFRQFKLWIAWYTTNPAYVSIPAPWTNEDLVLWQYTDAGSGATYGVESSRIDLNWFNGDEAAFQARFGGTVVDPDPPSTDVPMATQNGVLYYRIRRFNTDVLVHLIDLTKVRMKLTYGFDNVPHAVETYQSQLGFNGGGWGLQPGNVSAPNEYLIIEGVVKQSVAVDGRPCVEVTRDNRIVFHTTQPNFNTSWNVWGFDRIIAQNGVYNTRITDTNSEPRTVVGKDASGNLIYMICEGRQPNQKGLTFPEIWQVMRDDFNATDVGNCDGGYSSAAVNKAFPTPLLNSTYLLEVPMRRVVHQVLFFADGGVTPPPPGGDVKQFEVVKAVRPRSKPTMTTNDTDANIPAGTVFDSDIQQIDQITSSHPTMVHIASGPWTGKWIPLVYGGTVFCREIVVVPPTGRKIVKAVIEFDDQTTEELFP